jgi:hypothetical protein
LHVVLAGSVIREMRASRPTTHALAEVLVEAAERESVAVFVRDGHLVARGPSRARPLLEALQRHASAVVALLASLDRRHDRGAGDHDRLYWSVTALECINAA